VSSSLLILLAPIWLVLGLGVPVLASRRGRPFWPWLLYGVAFWPLAYLQLFFGKPPGPGEGPLGGDGD
jgi:hypothetical protein